SARLLQRSPNHLWLRSIQRWVHGRRAKEPTLAERPSISSLTCDPSSSATGFAGPLGLLGSPRRRHTPRYDPRPAWRPGSRRAAQRSEMDRLSPSAFLTDLPVRAA